MADYPSRFTGLEIDNAIEKVHEANSTPTAASTNMVTSGGVYAALQSKADVSDVPTALSDLSSDSTHRTVTDSEKAAWNAKYSKPNTGIPETDLSSDVQDSLDVTERFKRDLGYNATQGTITLTAGQTGKYIQCASRSAVANASFNISAPFNVDACDELLIKTGYNPSDSSHSSLDITVIAIYEETQRTRVVQEKDSDNHPLYYVVTYDEQGNPTVTTEKTTTNTGYPAYTTETYTEVRYLPNNEDRFVAIPDSGYYVASIPQSCKCVISYKPGVSDLSVIVVKHGAIANLASQIFGIYEHRTMAEAVTALAYKLDAIIKGREHLGNVTAGKVDVDDITTCNYPRVLYGYGVPSSSVIPVNLPEGYPWDGIPVFVGQLWVNLSAASGGLYYAVGVNSVANWINA